MLDNQKRCHRQTEMNSKDAPTNSVMENDAMANSAMVQPQCPACGRAEQIIWVHEHGQCAHCHTSIMPCCDGAVCETPSCFCADCPSSDNLTKFVTPVSSCANVTTRYKRSASRKRRRLGWSVPDTKEIKDESKYRCFSCYWFSAGITCCFVGV